MDSAPEPHTAEGARYAVGTVGGLRVLVPCMDGVSRDQACVLRRITGPTALLLPGSGDDFRRAIHGLLPVDLVAHGFKEAGTPGELKWRGTAWQALASGRTPILVHRSESENEVQGAGRGGANSVLVPLDGSEAAEGALPLAVKLARARRSTLWLVHVSPLRRFGPEEFGVSGDGAHAVGDDLRVPMRTYLRRTAGRVAGDVRTDMIEGSTIEALAGVVAQRSIGTMVFTCHGWHRSPRTLLGSVAGGLFAHLEVPFVIVPAR